MPVSADLVRRARARAGLTQAELAARLATTQSAIARWERGGSAPSAERLGEIAEACGFVLVLSLAAPHSPEQVATLRANLRRSPTDRLRRAAGAARFVTRGRAAMAAARRG